MSEIDDGLPEGAQSASDREMLAHIGRVAPPLLQKMQAGLLQIPFEVVWSAHTHWPLLPGKERSPVRISVLDSSFNPPTLAHLALANSKRPSYSNEPTGTDYDAKLLLLSVKNADKMVKPGDASYVQRLQMMALLAQDISTQPTVDGRLPNVAIGIIDEPTFVGKSRILREYFTLQHPASPPQLSFMVGMDTLERLFSNKYYPPSLDQPGLSNDQVMLASLSQMLSPKPTGDDSLVVCAKRQGLPSDISLDAKGESGLHHTMALASQLGWLRRTEDQRLGSRSDGEQRDFKEDLPVEKDERITLIDIGDEESRFSSTVVRNSRNRISALHSEVGVGPWRDWVTQRVATFMQDEKLYLG